MFAGMGFYGEVWFVTSFHGILEVGGCFGFLN